MKNKPAFFILLASQIIFVLFLFVWVIFTGFSVMMFDAPGAANNVGLWILYYTILAYPLGLLVGVVGSWIFYKRRKFKWCYGFNAIPLLWLLPILGIMIYANFIY